MSTSRAVSRGRNSRTRRAARGAAVPVGGHHVRRAADERRVEDVEERGDDHGYGLTESSGLRRDFSAHPVLLTIKRSHSHNHNTAILLA